jgi:hypothetical protein
MTILGGLSSQSLLSNRATPTKQGQGSGAAPQWSLPVFEGLQPFYDADEAASHPSPYSPTYPTAISIAWCIRQQWAFLGPRRA